MRKELATIGIIGGGQLARMSTQAAQQMGFAVVILDPDPDCPAAQVTPHKVVGKIDDPHSLSALAGRSDVITLENEWVQPQLLAELELAGATVYPNSHTVSLIGDKFKQREHMAHAGLPVPEAVSVAGQDEARQIAEQWGYPIVLKARLGGYDGYGVRVVRRDGEWDSRFPRDTHGAWYAERFVPFERELAVMVARNQFGDTAVYPVVESAQTPDGHRCDWILAPAPAVPAHIRDQAARVARDTVRAIEGVGIFGIELFLTAAGEILINEIAPRPHNSGHYTMDSCRTSQFAQHIRSVCGLPLGPTELHDPVAAMTNLLGVANSTVDLHACLVRALAAIPSCKVHWYGKRESRKGRKMGHINLAGSSPDEVLAQAKAARAAFWGMDRE